MRHPIKIASAISLLFVLTACGGSHHGGATPDPSGGGSGGSNGGGGGNGGGGNGGNGGTPPTPVLPQATAGVHTVAVTWDIPGATRSDLYISSAPNCDIRNYTSCPDGALATSVSPPFKIVGLANGQPYYLKLESIDGAGTRTVQPETSARPNVVAFNGAVNAIATTDDGSVYLGGEFTQAGVMTGSIVPLNALTGRLASAEFPVIDGSIRAVLPDGAGGWYVGGAFSAVAGLDGGNVAHFRADGSVDRAWSPRPNGPVNAIARFADVIYLGGEFTRLGSTVRNHLAAVDVAGANDNAGRPIAWDPNANAAVSALLVAGSSLYVGGSFTKLGDVDSGTLVAFPAALDPAAIKTWDSGADNAVRALASAGNKLYVGGAFEHIDNQARSHAAAFSLDAATPQLTDWSPGSAGPVRAFGLASDAVYVAGEFPGAAATEPARLMAVDPQSGAPKADWTAPALNGAVNAIAVSGNAIYIAGDFTHVGTEQRNYLATLDAHGALGNWNPSAGNPAAALALSGDIVYVGGSFAVIGAVTRNHLAALDPKGVLTAWNPNADGNVNALIASPPLIYAGGDFVTVGAGIARKRLAAFNTTDGASMTEQWGPSVDDGRVLTMALANRKVYVGGTFTSVNDGTPRKRLAAFGADAGGALDSLAIVIPSGSVNTILADTDLIFVGGGFIGVPCGSISNCNNLLSLNATTGAVTGWNPSPNQAVAALARSTSNRNQLFVGGRFSEISGDGAVNHAPVPRPFLAVIDVRAEARVIPDTFLPRVPVTALLQTPLGLYIGGTQFLDSINTIVDWRPGVDGTARALGFARNNIYIGGDFTNLGFSPRHDFGVITSTLQLVN